MFRDSIAKNKAMYSKQIVTIHVRLHKFGLFVGGRRIIFNSASRRSRSSRRLLLLLKQPSFRLHGYATTRKIMYFC
jgi:hypothetical protein